MNKRYYHFLKFQSFFLIIFFLISGGLSHLSAQITITSADIEQSLQTDFSASQSISSDTDNILSLIEINGADQEWDFTTLTFEEEYTGVYRSIDNPSEAPEGDDPHFAQATHATNLELAFTEIIDDEEHEIFLDIIVFIDLSDEELISLGGVMTEGISDNDEMDDQVIVTYSVPGRVDAQFPLTFESSWEYDYEMVGVFGNDTSSTEFEVIVDADGWGEIVTDEGREDVIRIKTTEIMTTGGIEFETYQYSFINQNGLEVASISGYSEAFDPDNEELEASKTSYSTSTSVENSSPLPNQPELEQNYPNPFNPSTEIKYSLPKTSYVQLEVFDILGQKVATLINGETKAAGNHTITFDAGNLSSGTYIYRLTSGGKTLTRKLMLIK